MKQTTGQEKWPAKKRPTQEVAILFGFRPELAGPYQVTMGIRLKVQDSFSLKKKKKGRLVSPEESVLWLNQVGCVQASGVHPLEGRIGKKNEPEEGRRLREVEGGPWR